MKNPFERVSSNKDEYTPDPEVLEQVKTQARAISPEASEADIEAASIRAMRAAETAGETSPDTEIIGKALKIEQEGTPTGDLLYDQKTGTVLRHVATETEAKDTIEEEREAA